MGDHVWDIVGEPCARCGAIQEMVEDRLVLMCDPGRYVEVVELGIWQARRRRRTESHRQALNGRLVDTIAGDDALKPGPYVLTAGPVPDKRLWQEVQAMSLNGSELVPVIDGLYSVRRRGGLEAERDAYERQLTIVEDRALELKAENRRLHAELKARTDERDAALNRVVSLLNAATMMNDAVETLEARVAARDADAGLPPNHTPSDKPEPVREPKPIPAGALKPPSGDLRRVGG